MRIRRGYPSIGSHLEPEEGAPRNLRLLLLSKRRKRKKMWVYRIKHLQVKSFRKILKPLKYLKFRRRWIKLSKRQLRLKKSTLLKWTSSKSEIVQPKFTHRSSLDKSVLTCHHSTTTQLHWRRRMRCRLTWKVLSSKITFLQCHNNS